MTQLTPTYHHPFPEGIEENIAPLPESIDKMNVRGLEFILRSDIPIPILAARAGQAWLFDSTLDDAPISRRSDYADKKSADIVGINHGDGTVALYSNLMRGVEVENGDYVDQGQFLGYANGNLIFRVIGEGNGTKYGSTTDVRSIPIAFEKRKEVHKLIGAYRAYKKNPQLHDYLRKEMKESLTFGGFEHVLRSVMGECNIYRREHEDIVELLVKEGSLRRGDAELYYIALPTRKADNLVRAYEHVHGKSQIPIIYVFGPCLVGSILGAAYIAFTIATDKTPLSFPQYISLPQYLMHVALLIGGGGLFTLAGAKLATALTAHSRNSAMRHFKEQAVSGEQTLERMIKGPSGKQNG